MKSKYTLQLLACGAAALMLAACGSQVKIQPDQTLEQMKNKITFTDQFETLDESGACRVFGVEEDLVSDCAALAGSGATAESLSVWEAKNTDDAQKIEEQLQTFVDGYIEGYSDYKPEEVPKLESAILSQEGNYVILCISADNDAAESIVKQALQA